MATAEELRDALERANVATNDIAADVRGLHDQIAALEAGAVSQADLDSLTEKATGLAARLEGVAAETPTPEPPAGDGGGEPPAEPPAEGEPPPG